jgi:Sulfotransferase family
MLVEHPGRMVRFIVLGHARNGSTLLTTALGQHEQVRIFGELFNDEEEERRRAFRAGCPLYRDGRLIDRQSEGRAEFYRDGCDGATFLREEVLYQRYTDDLFAVGFKIFYNQARTASAKSAWMYLRRTPSIRVIHLLRKNLLESLLSLRLAFLTGEWVRPRQAGTTVSQPPPIWLHPEETRAYFDEITAWRQWAIKFFRSHHMLEMEYASDLCSKFNETLQRAQEFLGIPFQPVTQLLEKQAQRSPADQISNYAELKTHFDDTPYGTFFNW